MSNVLTEILNGVEGAVAATSVNTTTGQVTETASVQGTPITVPVAKLNKTDAGHIAAFQSFFNAVAPLAQAYASTGHVSETQILTGLLSIFSTFKF